MISSDINVVSSRECKAKPQLNRGRDSLIFAKEKGAICVVYLSPLSVHDR